MTGRIGGSSPGVRRTDRLADVSPGEDHAILPRAEVAAVHESDQPSWQISTDQPQLLVIGLFIRDVAGWPSRNSSLPPASPAVPPVRWSNDRHQDHGATMQSSRGLLETKLLRDMERALARRARTFHLRITEIPVHGRQLWQLRPDRGNERVSR